jgi:hypothetical protein
VLRRNKRIGLIECSADQFTVNAIAQDAGLIAEIAETPDQFYLVHSGRNLASELETDLFAAAAKVLDHATRQGVIPRWSIIEGPDTAVPRSRGKSMSRNCGVIMTSEAPLCL